MGLVKGISTIKGRRVAEIAGGWVATPLTAGLFSFGLYKVISLLV